MVETRKHQKPNPSVSEFQDIQVGFGQVGCEGVDRLVEQFEGGGNVDVDVVLILILACAAVRQGIEGNILGQVLRRVR